MLDLLSDIGGFTSIFISGLSFLITIWNYKNFEYHFLTNFFKKKVTKTNKQLKVNSENKSNNENFASGKICNLKEYLLELIPSLTKVSCCRRNSKHAAIEKARIALNKEVNIIEIIRVLRYLKHAMRQVLPKQIRIEAKKSSRYVYLDSESDNNEK